MSAKVYLRRSSGRKNGISEFCSATRFITIIGNTRLCHVSIRSMYVCMYVCMYVGVGLGHGDAFLRSQEGPCISSNLHSGFQMLLSIGNSCICMGEVIELV